MDPLVLSLSALKALYSVAALLVAAVLLVFILRRMLFALAIFGAPRTTPGAQCQPGAAEKWPDVLILISCRDEESMVPGLCDALERLDYPAENCRLLLIDDGSRDRTYPLMKQFLCEQPGWNVLSLPVSRGKATALNLALEREPFGKIIYVLDADHRPNPDALKRIVRYFRDPQIAGVSGITRPSNALASPAAYYSTVETLVHQLVTMRAKDRFDLAPALLGSNCAYRRDLIDLCGGFRDGALLEDSDLTLAFYRAGYKIRFEPESVAFHLVPETVAGYLKQHRRWARGFADVALTHTGGLIRDRRLRFPLRLELFLFATGYLDRVALFGAMALIGVSILDRQFFNFPDWVVYVALLTPMLQIVALFLQQRAPAAMWLRLPLVPVFYLIDIFSALRSLCDFLLRRTRVWTKTVRGKSVHPARVSVGSKRVPD